MASGTLWSVDNNNGAQTQFVFLSKLMTWTGKNKSKRVKKEKNDMTGFFSQIQRTALAPMTLTYPHHQKYIERKKELGPGSSWWRSNKHSPATYTVIRITSNITIWNELWFTAVLWSTWQPYSTRKPQNNGCTGNWYKLRNENNVEWNLRSRDKTCCWWRSSFSSFKRGSNTTTHKKMTRNSASHVCVLCFGQQLMPHYSMFQEDCLWKPLFLNCCLQKLSLVLLFFFFFFPFFLLVGVKMFQARPVGRGMRRPHHVRL